ncbi:hypothetical protein PIB30_058213 [Stylosanthes scabra]|uniref:Uncharacterized protein n=1 Tax=Stylosanthes scabra TaxID=79078 RepID=A0ABU6RK91_9FABA|nr:hypothetical protein [Stylosanthes scabra]
MNFEIKGHPWRPKLENEEKENWGRELEFLPPQVVWLWRGRRELRIAIDREGKAVGGATEKRVEGASTQPLRTIVPGVVELLRRRWSFGCHRQVLCCRRKDLQQGGARVGRENGGGWRTPSLSWVLRPSPQLEVLKLAGAALFRRCFDRRCSQSRHCYLIYSSPYSPENPIVVVDGFCSATGYFLHRQSSWLLLSSLNFVHKPILGPSMLPESLPPQSELVIVARVSLQHFRWSGMSLLQSGHARWFTPVAAAS